MLNILMQAFYLQIPVVIGGVLHMVVVSRNLWSPLARPINVRLFGANKTWRGFVVVPLLTALGALCLLPVEIMLGHAAPIGAAQLVPAGLLAGLGYMLGELPNSWIKRRLGIAAGTTPARGRLFFMALDQLDSGVGVALMYAFYPGIAWPVCLAYALTFPCTALVVKRLLFRARLKANPA